MVGPADAALVLTDSRALGFDGAAGRIGVEGGALTLHYAGGVRRALALPAAPAVQAMQRNEKVLVVELDGAGNELDAWEVPWAEPGQ
jgi:hypothetical protein